MIPDLAICATTFKIDFSSKISDFREIPHPHQLGTGRYLSSDLLGHGLCVTLDIERGIKKSHVEESSSLVL